MARRGARGALGGRAARGLLQVDLSEFDVRLRLALNGDQVAKAAGRKLATKIRSQLRKGQTFDGAPLPQPQDGGEPLSTTGKLIRSIKYRPEHAMVMPAPGRRRDVSKRANSNFGLMAIHISGVYTRPGVIQNDDRPFVGDIMGSESSKAAELLEAEASREIDRQLRSGDGGIVTELKGRYRTARRAARRGRRR